MKLTTILILTLTPAIGLANWQVIERQTEPSYVAPDGMLVWNGPAVKGASHAIFELSPNSITVAASHRTVNEIWYCLDGVGEIWLKDQNGNEEVVKFTPGVTVTIPQGIAFQLRNLGAEPIRISGVTSPAWPANGDEALTTQGKWQATLKSGSGHG